MTRWFYADPLAAAWMAKHHGMWFSIKNGINPDARIGLPAIESHISYGHLQIEGGRFYIHPDSLHLLEPQVGDIAEFRSEVDSIYDVVKAGIGREKGTWRPTNMFAPEHRLHRIIQRSKMPFHWPSMEVV